MSIDVSLPHPPTDPTRLAALPDRVPLTTAARLSVVALVSATAFAFALTAFSPSVLFNADTLSHIATGQWILAHGEAPRTDPFSYSMPGAPWTAHEWLSEVLFALAYRAAGWAGVLSLTALAAASAILILGLRLARDIAEVRLLTVLVVGFSLIALKLEARPHMLALPIVAAWSAGLLAARDRGGRPPLAMALLMTPWSNLHGGFIFGLVLVAPFALEAVVASPRGERIAAALSWGLFAAAALGAALINPFGFDILVFPFHLLSIPHLSWISEWMPQDFSYPRPMEMTLLLLLAFSLTRPVRVPPIRLLLLIALIHMSLQHVRHEVLLGILGPMLLARPLADAYAGDVIGREWPRFAKAAVAIAGVVALALGGSRLALPFERSEGETTPISALKAVPTTLRAKHVLNQYGFGGYLIWSGVRPFIDGRAELYGDSMLVLYNALASGDVAALEDVLKRYEVAWTIFSPDSPVVAAMDREPGWRRLHADAYAVVHARDDAIP